MNRWRLRGLALTVTLTAMMLMATLLLSACRRMHKEPFEKEPLAPGQIEVVRLAHKTHFLAGGLPIGERKKLEVARVLATKPKLLLLDEVMGGLNPAESEEIIQLILDIKTRGLTQMVIEHDMKAIMRISDRIVVLNSGEKLAEGSPEAVVNNPDVVEAYLGESHVAD